ncbi:hypothetical protein MJO29_011526 [Puccinia striiformis f. sp. tritici]|nr:hypothetical protein MJO29_011526 [Puccinia striiformis f. sp. tritici]
MYQPLKFSHILSQDQHIVSSPELMDHVRHAAVLTRLNAAQHKLVLRASRDGLLDRRLGVSVDRSFRLSSYERSTEGSPNLPVAPINQREDG